MDHRCDLSGARAVRVALALTAMLGVIAVLPAQQTIATYLGDGTGEGFGISIRAGGDLDGDGVPDLLVKGDAIGASAVNDFLRAISGADGSTLMSVTAEPGATSFVLAFGPAGDVDGDGFDDVILGDYTDDGVGRVWILAGPDGARTIHDLAGSSSLLWFGMDVTGIGDVDADGRPDFAVGAPVKFTCEGGTPLDRVFVYSGADASLIHELSPSGPVPEGGPPSFGTGLSPAGDVDADGVPDFLVGSVSCCEFASYASVRAISGATGAQIHEITGFTNGFGYRFGMDGVGDLDGDGRDDILAGVRLASCNSPGDGGVEVYSGTDASVLFAIDGENGSLDQLGASVTALGDIDHDGVPDVAAGSAGAAGDEIGFVRAWSGRDGRELFTLVGAPQQLFGVAVANVGDLDDDGFDDVAIGVSGDDTAGPDFGKVIVISGYLPWVPAGGALAGAAGEPMLAIDGDPIGGAEVTLTLAGAAPRAASFVVVGFDAAFTPLLGGVLVPTPDVVLTGPPTDAAGAWTATSRFPLGVPPLTTLAVQAWIVDATAPAGFAASNAVLGKTVE